MVPDSRVRGSKPAYFASSVPGCRDKGDVIRIAGTGTHQNSRVENSTNLTSADGVIIGPIAIVGGASQWESGVSSSPRVGGRSMDQPRERYAKLMRIAGKTSRHGILIIMDLIDV